MGNFTKHLENPYLYRGYCHHDRNWGNFPCPQRCNAKEL